jgi:hypothetical protein
MIAQPFETAPPDSSPPESIPLMEYFRFRAQTPIRSVAQPESAVCPGRSRFQHMTFLYQSLNRLLLVFYHPR